MNQRITNWQVVEMGLEWSDYFQGFGVAFTPYTDSVNGIGDSARQAGEDALEMIACAGVDIPPELEAEIQALSEADETEQWEADHSSELEGEPGEIADCDHPWIHVGIRYNTEAT